MTKLRNDEINALALQLSMAPMATQRAADAVMHKLMGHLDREDQQAVFLKFLEITHQQNEAMAERFEQKMLH
jgi:hypothetical protein